MDNYVCILDLKDYLKQQIQAFEPCPDKYDAAVGIYDGLHRIPAANVAPVIHGKWINPHWQDSTHCMNCNQCKYEAQHRVYHGVEKYYRYCPNCGAKMD